jgi:hypothetical protein
MMALGNGLDVSCFNYIGGNLTSMPSEVEVAYTNKIKNLNKMVSVLSEEVDLDKFDKSFKGNIEEVLEERYRDKIEGHESLINLLKGEILEHESLIDKIKSLGGVAGGELLESYRLCKGELAVAQNIKEKDL